jgi:hypothetical protein
MQPKTRGSVIGLAPLVLASACALPAGPTEGSEPEGREAVRDRAATDLTAVKTETARQSDEREATPVGSRSPGDFLGGTVSQQHMRSAVVPARSDGGVVPLTCASPTAKLPG